MSKNKKNSKKSSMLDNVHKLVTIIDITVTIVIKIYEFVIKFI